MEKIAPMKNHVRRVFREPSPQKNQFELQAWASGQVICGVDEVARGCLAGPLVAAAVILPINTDYHLLKDSKLMTEEQRNEAYCWIVKHAWWATGWVHHRVVDRYGIELATRIAMKKAFIHVSIISPVHVSALVVDAIRLSLQGTQYGSLPVHAFCKAESLSCSVAAASIIAKVTRDRLMPTFGRLFPHYFFEKHKGYATKQHKLALEQFSQSLIHRKTFMYSALEHKKKEQYVAGEQTICGSD